MRDKRNISYSSCHKRSSLLFGETRYTHMTQQKKIQHCILISSQVCGSSKSASVMEARENLLPVLGIPPTSVALPRPPGSPGDAELTGDRNPVISTLGLEPAPKSFC